MEKKEPTHQGAVRQESFEDKLQSTAQEKAEGAEPK